MRWVVMPGMRPETAMRALLETVLDYIGDRDLVNRAIEIKLTGGTSEIEEYEISSIGATDG